MSFFYILRCARAQLANRVGYSLLVVLHDGGGAAVGARVGDDVAERVGLDDDHHLRSVAGGEEGDRAKGEESITNYGEFCIYPLPFFFFLFASCSARVLHHLR